jgi:hypothetical protein
MRRPREGDERTPPTPRGGDGAPPRAIRPRARSWLIAGHHGTPMREGAVLARDRTGEHQVGRRMVAESAARCIVRRRHGAPKGAASSPKGMMRYYVNSDALSRRAIPSLIWRGKKWNTAYPGRKECGRRSVGLGCLKFESARGSHARASLAPRSGERATERRRSRARSGEGRENRKHQLPLTRLALLATLSP